MKKIILFFLICAFFISNKTYSSDEKLKIFYSGFSFSNNFESNQNYAKYTSSIIKEKDPKTKINIISSTLLNSFKSFKFQKISLDTENLLDFRKYPDNAIVMSVVLQNEEFSQEYNSSTNVYSGFYDVYFEILFYDFSDKNLIASIPFDFEISMLSESKFNKDEIIKRIKNFYLKDKPFRQLTRKINSFEIKRKYDRRIGITSVNIERRALDVVPLYLRKNTVSLKNLIAQIFSKRLSLHHNVAIVPYTEGQSIGKAMKMRFVDTNKIYNINLANPDYHIHVNLKGFKKVLARTSDVEDLFLYGSFIDLKIFQPDLNKIYFNETLRGVTNVKIPKSQTDVNDWRKYNYNLEILFDNFSKNVIKPDNKWIKKATKKKIKKDLKKLNVLMDKVK